MGMAIVPTGEGGKAPLFPLGGRVVRIGNFTDFEMKLPPPQQILNTPEELHAFECGFFEVLCPWPPRQWMPSEYYVNIKDEHHYYLAGRGAGVIAWIVLAKLIQLTF